MFNRSLDDPHYVRLIPVAHFATLYASNTEIMILVFLVFEKVK